MVFWAFFFKKGASVLWQKHKARKNGGVDVPGEQPGARSSLPLLDYFVYFLPLPIILFYSTLLPLARFQSLNILG